MIVKNGFLLAFCRPGSDLLSQVLRHSTIGAEAFNDRVRDGIGFGHPAIATRPAKGEKKRCTRTEGTARSIVRRSEIFSAIAQCVTNRRRSHGVLAKGAGRISLAATP
jgi:hypothetical protein